MAAMSARVAMIVGVLCVSALAVAVPAMADDDSDTGGPLDRISASDHGSRTEDGGRAEESRRTDDKESENQESDDQSDNGGDASDKPAAPPDPNIVAGTPCTKTARACVDLAKQQAWLIDATAEITTGPVALSSGGPGEETPIGTFTVRWKDKTHVSKEYKNPQGQPAPMPYSVFFTPGGVAFHGGSVTRASAGCVHLDDADAQTFYNTLKLGDQVQVH
jgi:hypothetical protein